MENLYEDNWHYYKAQAELFNDDFDYYLNLCKGKKTLELFAGYGRVSNFLIDHGIDLETVELEPEFAKFINLPASKNHVCDVLKFTSDKKFDRIIACYNSFTLITKEDDIHAFFKNMESLLEDDGILALSYYPLNAWKKLPAFKINVNSEEYSYTNNYDFSELDQDVAIWIDEYHRDGKTQSFSYPTRVYKHDEVLKKFLANTSFKLVDQVINYNRTISNDIWIEFILKKN
jgi:hypothetical protein